MKRCNHEIKKILIFCILIFSIIFISEASAKLKDILENDGNNWITLPDSYRLGFVFGFLDGATVVRNEFYFFVDKEIYNKILNRINIADVTVGQIMDGMDAFYNDFSNRRIKIVDAIYVVKMQIKGEDPELIDSQIRYLKMQPLDKKMYLEKYAAFIKKKGSSLTYK